MGVEHIMEGKQEPVSTALVAVLNSGIEPASLKSNLNWQVGS